MANPNVILMFVDDLGIGDISAFNTDSKISTTNIDALAKEGMKFTDAHASSSICTPSRYGLLTGRYPFRSKIKHGVITGDSMPLIEKDRMTLGNLFKQNGYNTACVGKWHLGLEWQLLEDGFNKKVIVEEQYYTDIPKRDADTPTLAPIIATWIEGLDIDYTKPILKGPNDYGFDYFFGMAASLDQPPYTYIENNHVIYEPVELAPGPVALSRLVAKIQDDWQCGPIAKEFKHENVLDDMNDKVLNLIDDFSQKEEPFFIYYPTPAVHGPCLPNKDFKGKSGLNAYTDVVLQTDHYVKLITDKLKEKGIFDNTIFIFTSDNGCSKAADIQFLEKNGHFPSYIYNGYKFSLYEGGHRIPMIISYPDKIAQNTVCNKNICQTDFFATFADLLHTQLPDNIAEDSFSNLDLWEGKNECERTSTVYSCGSGFLGVLKGDYKLCCISSGGDSPQTINDTFNNNLYTPQKFELYNIVKDPSEKDNIIDEYPEITQDLKNELTKALDNGRTNKGEEQENSVVDNWFQINWK